MAGDGALRITTLVLSLVFLGSSWSAVVAMDIVFFPNPDCVGGGTIKTEVPAGDCVVSIGPASVQFTGTACKVEVYPNLLCTGNPAESASNIPKSGSCLTQGLKGAFVASARWFNDC